MKHCVKCKYPMDDYMRGYKIIYTLCMDCEMDKVFEVPTFTSTLKDSDCTSRKNDSEKAKI